MADVYDFPILVCVLAIPAIEIFRRRLVIKKFKDMFPGREYKLGPPLYDIGLEDIPYNRKGREYIAFYQAPGAGMLGRGD
jgi:hypothetical protein